MGKELRSSIMQYDTSEDTQYLTHGIFRWYGKLVPPLVKDVLESYTEAGDVVLANFNGSGTIALEGMVHGVKVIGNDINPLAILVSRVKTTKLPDLEIESLTDQIIADSKTVVLKESDYLNLYDYDKWYKGETINDLLKLKIVIKRIKNIKVQEFFLVSLLGIVRECSNIDSRCVNHIVVDFKRPVPDVFGKFRKEAISNYRSIKEIDKINTGVEPDFKMADARNLPYLEDESVDFVFSHPPYLNAINYYNIHRLCTDLAGFEYKEIRDSDFSSKKLETFLQFMDETIVEAKRVLKPGKRIALVIGDTRYQGNIIPLGIEMVNLFRKEGFDIEDIFIWVLTKKAGMNVARRGNHIDHNYVIIAKKKGA